MGKTRDLFKKIRDTNGKLHAKMGLIRDKNGIDLSETEDIKKVLQEYTEELYKNGKWLSQEALQIAEERRDAKSKGEKERYSHLNAEFQRIVRRDKKDFLSYQCKEIEENNRMGKTRYLQENQRYQMNISCKDGLNKEQKWYGPNKSKRY